MPFFFIFSSLFFLLYVPVTTRNVSDKLIFLLIIMIIDAGEFFSDLILAYVHVVAQLFQTGIIIPEFQIDKAQQHNRILWYHIHILLFSPASANAHYNTG